MPNERRDSRRKRIFAWTSCLVVVSSALFGLSISKQPKAYTEKEQVGNTNALTTRYLQAVTEAHSGRLAPAPLFVPRANALLRVATWFADPTTLENALGQTIAAHSDFWVTVEPELLDRCKALTAEERSNLIKRVKQMLGLPWDYGADAEGVVVTLELATYDEAQFFRPCMDRATTTLSCDPDFPESSATPEHVAWMRWTWAQSYPDKFPWTRLGYTYDWANPASKPYGLSEYVVRKGALIKVINKQALKQYCSVVQ